MSIENLDTIHTSRTDADKHSLSIAHEQPLPEWFLNAPIQTEFRRGNVAASEGRIAELERELAAATARAEKAEAELADANGWRDSLRGHLEKRNTQLSLAEARIAELESQLATANAAACTERERYELYKAESINSNARCIGLSQRIAELEAVLKPLVENLSCYGDFEMRADTYGHFVAARAALARQTAKPCGTYVDEAGDTVCIDTRTVIPATKPDRPACFYTPAENDCPAHMPKPCPHFKECYDRANSTAADAAKE